MPSLAVDCRALIAALLLCFGVTPPLAADPLRIATFNSGLSRDGPGLLLRDILKGKDPQVIAAQDSIVRIFPDIIVLQKFDFDMGIAALHAFADALGEQGAVYPYRFARQPNSGLQTDHDLDGDGDTGDAGDAQGYGRFFGEGGMAILSKYPIAEGDIQDFSGLLWRDLPGALLPTANDGSVFPNDTTYSVQRLSSVAHWVVPIDAPSGRVWLMTFHATPPVFDGPEDRNGKRNHDEIAFWLRYMDGAFGPAPTKRFFLLGDANNDPKRGEGLKPPLLALLNDPRLSDPLPDRVTADWDEPVPGDMRVDYVLPSRDWHVIDAGVAFNPDASRHAIVWVAVE